MEIQKLSSNILYQKELENLGQLPDDIKNIVFNIAINECSFFPRFTIFKAKVYKYNIFDGYRYWVYIGSFNNKLVLMNLILQKNNFQSEAKLTANKLIIVNITPDVYQNNILTFRKYTTKIIDISHISKYDLELVKTNLAFKDYLF